MSELSGETLTSVLLVVIVSTTYDSFVASVVLVPLVSFVVLVEGDSVILLAVSAS